MKTIKRKNKFTYLNDIRNVVKWLRFRQRLRQLIRERKAEK